ncbi:DUF1453 domain-containing protein [Luteimonas sp. e5]
MPLLLIPLLILLLFLVLTLLMPFSLWQRYRQGRKRRKVWPWMNAVNAWLLLVSLLMLLLSAWISARWLPGSPRMAFTGLGLGLALGWLHLRISRGEARADGYWLTPNALIVFALTALVAARIGLGIWQLATHGLDWRSAAAGQPWYLRHDSLFALGGLLIGHWLAWAWLLRARLRRLPGR